MTVAGVDDFASMREVITRRYRRLLDEQKLGAPGPDSGTWDTSNADQGTDALNGLNRRFDNGTDAWKGPGPPGAPDPSPSGTWVTSNADQETDALKGHDFSRAENSPNSTRALAPEGRPSKEPKTLPSLILVDGGLGQLHAAAEALESLGLTTQPLASIAKKEEIIYLYGNEDEPVVLDRHSPVLHLIQLIRDESHRFAIGYHRQRRAMRDRDSELLNIPGVGPQTRQRLLTHFGSLRDVQQATAESLAAVVPRKAAETIWRHFHQSQPTH
jgi:excinuclease UvrABC nuclease subunit